MQERSEQQPAKELTQESPQQHQIAENPNPRANENIRHTPFDEKDKAAESVGSEITDGEAG